MPAASATAAAGRSSPSPSTSEGVVRDAISLRGFTTFARPGPCPPLIGVRVNQVKGDRDIPGLGRQQREAARQAATLMRPASGPSHQEVLG